MGTRLDRVSERVHATLADPTVRRQVGRKCLAENEQMRRVVWVRVPSSVEPPKRAGGTKVKDDTGTDRRIRVVYDRWENLELHIFAEDDEQAELLFDALLAALHLELGTDVVPGRYEWVTERENRAGVSVEQPEILLEAVVKMPVSDESKGLRRVVEMGHDHPPGDPFNHS